MNHEKAFEDWLKGMKYKDIAEKYGVKENTVKSWYKRYKWKAKKEQIVQESVRESVEDAPPSIEILHGDNRLRRLIESDLKEQLKLNETEKSFYINLIDDYMAFWDIKNMLIEDIRERGVVVWGVNAQKKNDSISELNKTNAQMLRILADLGLKATDMENLDDEDEEL
ncbi:hypothetical protein A0U40_09795 [[Bacillus] sp. KCTC 13219]|nr:hypothetical protein A0U40_09795 [[Bacillus] sp. KCTC 13219]